jgi:hypothetical protein
MTDEQTSQPDDTAPVPERQSELRAAYAANIAAGQPPYAGVVIGSRGELKWILSERRWQTQFASFPSLDAASSLRCPHLGTQSPSSQQARPSSACSSNSSSLQLSPNASLLGRLALLGASGA